MTQTIEQMSVQLDNWLAQGFSSPEEREAYQALKEQYEDESLDYSFSKREVMGQLNLIRNSPDHDFPDLDEATHEEYLALVAQLEELDKTEAEAYRNYLT